MPIEMMEVRPDYLLYPNRDTDVERAEYIRLFDDKSKLLPAVQD
jgi:hypothetical protein